MSLEDREFKLKEIEDKRNMKLAVWDKIIHIAIENKLKILDEYDREEARLLASSLFDEITKPLGAVIDDLQRV